jgi:hypothetical protein
MAKIDEKEVVTNVVSALQPSITEAVAKALAEEPGIAVDTTKPVYSYEYTVAGNDTNTYITKSERREGDLMTGTYSYLDPEGALVTVTYEAGPDGYSQTLDKQEGFTAFEELFGKASKSSFPGEQVTNTKPKTTPRPILPSQTPSSRPSSLDQRAASSNLRTTHTRQSTYAASSTQSALISEIISALQPTISSAVQRAITPDSIGQVEN